MVSKRYVVANSSFGVENISTLSALLDPAAEAGHREAQFNLGVMFRGGEGVSADPHKAFEWIQKGTLSRIHPSASKTSARSTRFSTQPQKQETQMLNSTSDICFYMEKESLRILTRRSNGIKKVGCREFILRRRKHQHAQRASRPSRRSRIHRCSKQPWKHVLFWERSLCGSSQGVRMDTKR